jgi:hypothetical protein
MRDGGGGEVKARGQRGGEPTAVGEAREQWRVTMLTLRSEMAEENFADRKEKRARC